MAEQEKAASTGAPEAGTTSLLDELVESARIKPSDDAYPIARSFNFGISAGW